jgi:hypothetical protein
LLLAVGGLGLASQLAPGTGAQTLAGTGYQPRFDGDPPIPLGLPEAEPHGAVEVLLPSGGVQVLTREMFPTLTVGEGFGDAVATADVNGDGYGDLLVSSVASSQVHVLLGSSTGITPEGAHTISTPGRRDDGFGATVLITGTGTRRMLWVGAPGTRIGPRQNAGAIYQYGIGDRGEVRLITRITQDTDRVPGQAEAGDRFGEVLAPAREGIFVGVPHEEVGSKADAGEVFSIQFDVHGRVASAWATSQDSPAVADRVEAGDLFGASLGAAGSGDLIAGVPGEDIGTAVDAGMVQTFDPSGQPLSSYRQASPRVGGQLQAGSHFGQSVLQLPGCQGSARFAVGAPGTDVDGQRGAGEVRIFSAAPAAEPAAGSDGSASPGSSAGPSSGQACSTTPLQQGSGLIGAPTEQALVGQALGLLEPPPGSSQTTASLLVGAPGVGMVFRVEGDTVHWWTYPGVQPERAQLGSVIPGTIESIPRPGFWTR